MLSVAALVCAHRWVFYYFFQTTHPFLTFGILTTTTLVYFFPQKKKSRKLTSTLCNKKHSCFFLLFFFSSAFDNTNTIFYFFPRVIFIFSAFFPHFFRIWQHQHYFVIFSASYFYFPRFWQQQRKYVVSGKEKTTCAARAWLWILIGTLLNPCWDVIGNLFF